MAFQFKPFGEMTGADYAAVGLRCGLEIHQQLRTRHKLFCRCPAGRYSGDYDAVLLRHMRPTLSELGEYDRTALMEEKTRKNIYYRIHRETVCTYDMDDSPPFAMNEEALDIALETAMLLRANLVSELHVARKQYLDGSIPAGFQRTTLLGIDGWIPYQDHRVAISQIALEEDSCREHCDVGHDRVFLTDRLGTPLVEIVTAPEIETPREAADVAEILRRLTRATGKVRTGYGAARQDVNVSIHGGTRVEVKGVPSIGRIPLLIYNEAMRQHELLRIRAELQRRRVLPDTFHTAAHDVTGLVSKTIYPPMRASIDRGQRVMCVVLTRFAGLLARPVQTDTSFAKEFSDRVRVIACLTDLPNILHSDTAAELITGREWQKLRKRLRAGAEDALILVWGPRDDAALACEEIVARAREAISGVPPESRQPLDDGTTAFERILPGPERMYPDTDLPPIVVSDARLGKIRRALPTYPWQREQHYLALGLNHGLAVDLCLSPHADLFERIVRKLRSPPMVPAVILTQGLRYLARRGLSVERLDDETLFEVFAAWREQRLAREGILKVLRHLVAKEDVETPDAAPRERAAGAITSLGLEPLDQNTLESHVAACLARARIASIPDFDARRRHVMGLLMHELRGRVEGSLLAGRVEAIGA